MLKAALCVLIAFCLRADVVEQGVKDSAPSGLLAGVARADITPPVGIASMNWGSQTHIGAEGIDPAGMLATALVISDGRQKFAMVDIDLGGVEGLDDAIARASEATGIPAAHIRLGATHTHSAPYLAAAKGPAGADLTPYKGVYERYRQVLADKVVGAIVEANSRLKPAHLSAGKGLGTININRRFRARDGAPPAVGRNPDEFVDRELVVARIDDAAGKPLAVLVNFQCHGTVLAFENKLITPDWIGMMRRTVEQALPGARCLFFQGAAGNQGPVEGFTGDLQVAHRLGRILGHQASALALTVDTVRREPKFEGYNESSAYQARQYWRVSGPRDATLNFASRRIKVPRRTYSADEIGAMRKLVNEAKAKAEETQRSGDSWKIYQAGARLRRFSDLLAQFERPADPSPLPVDIQVLRIGDLAVFAMPGEPFAEIGAAVKKASPFTVTMFCGYSSGAGGDYMPIETEYRYGGYEVQRTPYNPGAAQTVIEEAQRLFAEVR